MQYDPLRLTKEEQIALSPSKCMNINLGVLGHVDSGKTSICKLLSSVISTASMDRNPQSQQRGITLDLGFSAFFTKVPMHFAHHLKEQYMQFTLVDCPGHASLIRTVIGGAQIIDTMLLIIDITKGIQTQTAQCIIIAELTAANLIVVLNKIDLLQQPIDVKINGLKKVFAKTKFTQNVLMVPFSTKVQSQFHCNKLKEIILKELTLPQRKFQNKFLYMIDHCFKIKGKGTVITGTVIEGKAKVGDEIQICELQQRCKIKSMEMFKKAITSVRQGDRVAMLMHHLQANQLQRGVACTPGYLQRVGRIIIDLHVVRLYKRPIKNKSFFNIMFGHQTVEGELRLFLAKEGKLIENGSYLAISQVQETQYQGQLFAVVNLTKEFYTKIGSQILGYKPDIDNDEKTCRIAFHGSIVEILEKQQEIKLFKEKIKKGVVDRVVDQYSLIAKQMFDKDANIQYFIGKNVILEKNGFVGKIDSSFGKSGKVKIFFKQQLPAEIEGTILSINYTKWYH